MKKLLLTTLLTASLSAMAGPVIPTTFPITVHPNTITAQAEASVDINQATVEQLVTLKHVGPKLAQNIVNYRTQNGPFKEIHDLVNVPGISEKLLADILNDNPDRVTIGS